MPLKTNFNLKEIQRMVRKEIIQFEPADRIPLELTAKIKDGRTMNYLVGGVYYSPDNGDVCYELYNGNGQYISPAKGERRVADLNINEIKKLQCVVADYYNRAMHRAANMKNIAVSVENNPGKSIKFSESRYPSISVESVDGERSMLNVTGIFQADSDMPFSELMVSGITDDGKRVTSMLAYVSDGGVSVLSSAIDSMNRKESVKTKIQKGI